MCRVAKSVGLILGLCSVVGIRGQNVEVTEIAKPDRVWVSGVVVDASGAGIGQSELVLERGGAEVAEAKASAAGRFEVPLPEGIASGAEGACSLVVTAAGFEPSTTPVACGAEGRALTIQLGVARASEQVEVEGDAAGGDVEPNETQLGSVLNRQQMASVPLNGRSFTDLLALTPGVVPQSSTQPNAVVMSGVASTPPSGDLDIGALSVSGQRETQNAFRVNAANVQEDENMGVAVVPTLDSISDLEVLTSEFDAKLGNQSGGQISVTTRSGGDRLHGSVYDYFRNTALDARNYFSLTRAPFHQQMFGGTIGGPVPRAKNLFFFGDYQGTRQTQGVDTGLIAVPTVADRAGNLSDQSAALTGSVSGPYFAQLLSSKLGYAVAQGEPYYSASCTAANAQCVFPGGVIPQSVFSAPAQHLLQYIPQPNAGSGTFSTSTYAQTVRDDKGSVRVDRETRWGALMGYYFLDDYSLLNPYPTGQGGATVPGFNAQTNGRAQLVAVNLQTVMGATGTNLAHVSYMRNAAAAGQPRGGVGVSLASQGFVTGEGTSGIVPLLPDIEGVANVIFNGYTMGVDVTSLYQAENTFEVGDDMSRTIGQHVISFGADFHADQINTHPTVYDNGSFSFTGSETGSDFADFLLGIDSSYTQGQGQKFYNRNHYLGLYGQDSWRVSPQLTLNYGLRWDVLPPWSEKFNQLQTLNPDEQSLVFPNAPKGILFPGDPGVPTTLSPTRYGNVAPRVAASWAPKARPGALAWMLGAPGATLVKAGYGVYYSAFEGLSAGIMSGNPPYGFTDTSAAPTLFNEPFVTAATGVSVGQRFPLQTVAYGASQTHPNTSVNWANFEPLDGIPAFAMNNVTPYAENYSVSVEREVGAHTVVSAGYVGTQAHHLLVIQEVNPGDPAACLALSTPASVASGSATCGPFGESSTYTTAAGKVVQGTRTDFGPAFGSVNLQRTIANSHDNALEVSVKHSTRTLFLQVGYTWSKSIDQSSSLAEAVYPNVPGLSNAGMSRALSAFDLTQNFVATYRYTLPLGSMWKGHARLTEGWNVSGLTRFSTGFPVTLLNNNDTSLLGTQPNGINNNGIDEPEVAVGDMQVNHRPGTGGYAFNTNLFSLPALGTLGNARRRFFYGPGAENTDLALEKTTQLRKGMSLDLRAEAFNVFNHGQFFGPAAVSGNISSTNFGQVQSSSSPRLMQLAARFTF
ncbi:carboxypeptidase-like regulatory domain-containing protein [Granulicella sp. L46]|uniref:TonB-dependent receptor n=1 Tax=Granulicella sp. L46 TaxID=1641865 RepID=UPI00131BEEFB|nr:carboxypeptidase-like regulatory domain-containing protein [Granulicella sp. L46]